MTNNLLFSIYNVPQHALSSYAHHWELKTKAFQSLRSHFERNVEVRAMILQIPCFFRDRDDAASAPRNYKRRQKPTAKYNKHWYSRQEGTACVRRRETSSFTKALESRWQKQRGQGGKTRGAFLLAWTSRLAAASSLGIHTFTHFWPLWGLQPKLGEFERIQPDNNNTLTKWKHADFHAVMRFSGVPLNLLSVFYRDQVAMTVKFWSSP